MSKFKTASTMMQEWEESSKRMQTEAEIRADERKKVLEDVCGILANEIWNRAKTHDDHMHNHCIRRCIALVRQIGEGDTHEPLVQSSVWQVYTKECKATGQIYVDGDAASKCAETIGGYVVEARLIRKEKEEECE